MKKQKKKKRSSRQKTMQKRRQRDYIQRKKRKKKRKQYQKQRQLGRERLQKKRLYQQLEETVITERPIKEVKETRRHKKKARAKRAAIPIMGRGLARMTQTAVLLLLIITLYLIGRPKVVEELVVEAGSRMPELSEFLMREYEDVSFARPIAEQMDINTVADYEIAVIIAKKEYFSTLHVVDTRKPKAVTKDMQIYKDNSLEPMDFIEKIDDATKTRICFAKTPDFSAAGIQDVKIRITDAGENSVTVSARLEIIEDTEPPDIEGVEELTVAVGDSISYKKNVTVSDNYDERVKLEIDNGEVDLNTVGDYPVTYRAKDAAGNEAEESTVVHVKPPSVETATEEMVNKKADEILRQITTDNMSQYEKANAIFNWVHGSIGWSDGTPKTNWIQGAYRGLFSRRGDCYVYASASKCLLTRAGIANMDIGFVTERRTHFWNLIDIGEGWYHFDTTRRTDGRSFFYYKDEDIRAYSNSHNGSHAYDPSKYPAIQ